MITVEVRIHDDVGDRTRMFGAREAQWKDLDSFYRAMHYLVREIITTVHTFKVEQHGVHDDTPEQKQSSNHLSTGG